MRDFLVGRPAGRSILFLGALAAAVSLLSATAGAWVYPEHRQTTARGILGLSRNHREVLQELWTLARAGHEQRLSPDLVDSSGAAKITALDYAAWPAIAGDHSCSPADMLSSILTTDWILDVADVTAQLERDLSNAGFERYRLTNALRDSDLRLQRVDPGYVTRAGANSVHFLLARPYAETDEGSYIETCLGTGCEPNALGAWAWFHLRAIEKALRLARQELSEDERELLARAALADEAYGLHFLQDVFASGHVAGTRGSAAERKGTHDYYNEHGLETRTWAGHTVILKGDAWMRPQDADLVGRVVQLSLEQFLDACRAAGPFASLEVSVTPAAAPDTLNTCLFDAMPGRDIPPGIMPLLTQVINRTPVPGLAEGEGELPRFRAEIGPFIGVVPAARGGLLFNGFTRLQPASAVVGGLELAVRLGLGLDGVMNESGDGLVFLDLGLRLDAATSSEISQSADLRQFGSILATVPSRTAITTRVRLPFWLVPFDLLLTAPFLLPTDPATYTGMAVQAGNGGLIPWQSGIATPAGRFQFIAGREIGVAFHGYVGRSERLLLPIAATPEEVLVLASVRSVYLEFPVVEYMPFRTFSSDQSSSLVLQLFGGVDIPVSVSDIYPVGAPEPEMRSVWQVGLRAAFRWRHYW